VENEAWQIGPSGELSTVVYSLRLVVRTSTDFARFLVLRRSAHGGEDHEILLASGSEADIAAAKLAARRMAMRLESVIPNQMTRSGPVGVDNG